MKQNSNSRTTKGVPPAKAAWPLWRLASVLLVLGGCGLAYLHFANSDHRPPTAPATIVVETRPQKNPERKRSSLPPREVQVTSATTQAGPTDATSASVPADQVQVRQWVSTLVA